MILDSLKNIGEYTSLGSKMEKALKFIADEKTAELADGKYEIDGQDVYAMVKSYTTDPDKEHKWEAHEKYIDIQCILKGKEIIGWNPVDQLTIKKEYNPEKDIAFYNEPANYTELKLTDKYFAVLYPQDAHMPGHMYEKPADIKKVIVKIKMD